MPITPTSADAGTSSRISAALDLSLRKGFESSSKTAPRFSKNPSDDTCSIESRIEERQFSNEVACRLTRLDRGEAV